MRIRFFPLFVVAVLAVSMVPVDAYTPTYPSWVESGKLTASDAAPGDEFGLSVAADGTTVVVGAHADDDLGSYSGSAYIFTRSGTTWAQQAKLTASDGAAGDQFGRSVAISGDTVVIGARGDGGSGDLGDGSGSAYVFTRSGSTWTQQAKLAVSDMAADDSFGSSVAIAGDTAVIGTSGYDLPGSAYVFTRSGSTWTQQAELTAFDGAAGDHFGSSVAIGGDTAVVGAWSDGGAWLEPDWWSGSAYVFTRSGSTWTQQAKLTASDAAAADCFGWSVAIRDDAALIGAPVDSEFGNGPGSAYVFTRSGSAWTEQAKLMASDGDTGDEFGRSVAMSDDTALIGASEHDVGGLGSYTGSSYVFTGSGSTWAQQAKLTASDAVKGEKFGSSVAISGTTALIGAPKSAGSVYVFEPPNQAPSADAGGPYVGLQGTPITFSGAASYDPDGVVATYLWDFGDGGSSTESESTHTYAAAGTFAVTLTVTDNRGAIGVDTTQATIASLRAGGTFDDDDGNIHEASIEAIAGQGITRGCNPPVNDQYCPGASVTRGQMAAFLVRALGLTDDGGGNMFTDDDGSVFENDIAKLAAAGITKGCNPPDNTMYCPDASVTRGQMAAFLVRALGLTDDGGGNLFTDDDGSVFENDIDKLGTAGVTKGCNPPDNDSYCPADLVKRDQMASFLTRALNLTPIVP